MAPGVAENRTQLRLHAHTPSFHVLRTDPSHLPRRPLQTHSIYRVQGERNLLSLGEWISCIQSDRNGRQWCCGGVGAGPFWKANWLEWAGNTCCYSNDHGGSLLCLLFYKMVTYLHSFYFNQGEIIWICLKGKRIERADISGRNNAPARNWNLNENLWTILTQRAFIPTRGWLQNQTSQPPGVQTRWELQLSGVRGCWFLLHLLGLNIFEDLKRAFISFPFMIPFGAYLFPFHASCSTRGGEEVSAYSQNS